MHTDSGVRVQPRVQFLGEDDVTALHEAALAILDRTGVIVHHEDVVELLAGAGCAVSDGNRVRIPGAPVEEAAPIALRAVARQLNAAGTPVEEVIFVLFDQDTYQAYSRALAAMEQNRLE